MKPYAYSEGAGTGSFVGLEVVLSGCRCRCVKGVERAQNGERNRARRLVCPRQAFECIPQTWMFASRK